MKRLKVCVASLFLSFMLVGVHAQDLDRIAIVVDNDVVLESEIQTLMNRVRRELIDAGRTPPSDSALRTQATERLILQNLQLQMAERAGLRIGDAQLDQTIAMIAADENMPVDALRQQITTLGMSWSDYREEIRREIVMNEVQRAQVSRRIYISPQETNMLVRMIRDQDGSQIEYNIGHILIGFQNEAGEEDEPAARRRADAVMQVLEAGEDFADVAITASNAANALEGGAMGWLSLNAMPTLFANAIEQNPQAGSIIGPLRSGVGFHILRVHDVRGAQQAQETEVRARHILIQPSVILSESRARQLLEDIRRQIVNGEKSFGELAAEHSADPGSAANNGDLGWRNPEIYVPEFKQKVQTLEANVLSEPFRTEHGWHIVEVLDRRTVDVTDQRIVEYAQNMLYSRKYQEELESWFQEIREAAYVEFKQ